MGTVLGEVRVASILWWWVLGFSEEWGQGGGHRRLPGG